MRIDNKMITCTDVQKGKKKIKKDKLFQLSNFNSYIHTKPKLRYLLYGLKQNKTYKIIEAWKKYDHLEIIFNSICIQPKHRDYQDNMINNKCLVYHIIQNN